MVCLHGQSKNTGQTLIWSHLTRNSGLNTYISSSNAKLNVTIFAHEIFQKLENPKKGCRKNILTSQGIEGFAEVVIAPNMVEGTLRGFFRGGGDVGICRCSKCLQEGSEVSSSFGIAFYRVPDVTLKFLRIFFMPAFFLPFLCFVEGRVWRFPLKGSWWHELKGKRLFITGRRFYPRKCWWEDLYPQRSNRIFSKKVEDADPRKKEKTLE